MFTENTLVAWATKNNTFMGTVIESNENTSVILVTSTAKGDKHNGTKAVVANVNLGDITSGRTIVTRI